MKFRRLDTVWELFDDCRAQLAVTKQLAGRGFPELAAGCSAQSTTLDVMEHRLRTAFGVHADTAAPHRHRLQVVGGPVLPESFDPVVAQRLAEQLCALIPALLRLRSELVWCSGLTLHGPVRRWGRNVGRLGLSFVGPSSVLAVVQWCRDTSVAILRHSACASGCPLPGVLVERSSSARVAGFAAGAVTPAAMWLFAELVTAAAWRLGTSRAGLLTLVLGFVSRHRARTWVGNVLAVAAVYGPTRFPRSVDVVLKHTLPWWQGYVSGWNSARVVWQVVASSTFPVSDTVPLLERPATVADLNATIVRVGGYFERFVDAQQVVNGPPVAVSPAPASLRLPDLVTMSDEVMANGLTGDNPADQASAIRVLTVAGDSPRFVVVIPGTQSFSTTPVRNPYTMTQNLHLMAFGTASNVDAVVAALQAERSRQGIAADVLVKVLAYGHSQGGLIAAQLSRDARLRQHFEVECVVTTGAPLAGRSFPEHTSFLCVEHIEDLIPKLDLTENPAAANVVTVKTLIVPFGEQQRVLDVHRWIQYRDTMARCEASEHPVLRQALASVQPFLVGVVAVSDYPQFCDASAQ